MAMNQIQESITLTAINCGECGGTYCINERYRAQRYEKGGGWHCPYCQCSWGYFGDTEAAKLKKALEAEQRNTAFYKNNAASERASRECTERRLIAAKGAKIRLRNRIKNGVCPCCTRSFENLANHIKTKHPDFKAEEKEIAG